LRHGVNGGGNGVAFTGRKALYYQFFPCCQHPKRLLLLLSRRSGGRKWAVRSHFGGDARRLPIGWSQGADWKDENLYRTPFGIHRRSFASEAMISSGMRHRQVRLIAQTPTRLEGTIHHVRAN
jgi:hypothetical protein